MIKKYYDRFMLNHNSGIIPTIVPCICKDIKYKDKKRISCSEANCGLTFDDAKQSINNIINKYIEKLNTCDNFNEYNKTR